MRGSNSRQSVTNRPDEVFWGASKGTINQGHLWFLVAQHIFFEICSPKHVPSLSNELDAGSILG